MSDERRDAELRTVAATFNGGDSYTAQLVLRERYETLHGIFNHDDPVLAKKHPLALVEAHPKEDSFSYSMVNHYLNRFRDYGIFKEWGYTFTTFMDLPMPYIQKIFAIEQRRAAQRVKEQEKHARMERELRQTTTQAAKDSPGLKSHRGIS